MGKKNVCDIEREKISEEDYKSLLSDELQRQGLGGPFVWAIFFLCVTPNILNGFHVSSYILIGHLPDDQWCEIHDLQNTNWTVDERRLITQGNLTTKGCTIWDWDYKLLSNMTFYEALSYTTNQSQPEVTSCSSLGRYSYDGPDTTFVAEWDLICERSIDRTSAMFLISLGKLMGSLIFGVFADKYGRKSALTLGGYIFIVSSFICTYAPWYSLFLFGRFGLGVAAPGFFYPALTIIVENLSFKHSSWMSVFFLVSYSIGMILLSAISHFITPWRHLQLVLTVPSLLLILSCYLINESVQWLITKKRYDDAYKVLFKRKSHFEMIPAAELETEKKGEHIGCWKKIKNGPLKEMLALFATPTKSRHILTSNFVFCIATVGYYVTALNASNISLNRNLFVGLTGVADLPSYLVPVIMLRCITTRTTTMLLFLYAGIANLLFVVVSTDNNYIVIALSMLGRGSVLSSYSVMNLYHADIYPTEIRNSALGTCSMWAYIGALLAPYIVDYGGQIGWYIPTTICGAGLFFAGLMHLTLPLIHKDKKPVINLKSEKLSIEMKT